MSKKAAALFVIVLAIIAGAILMLVVADLGDPRGQSLFTWWRGNEATRRALSIVRREACPGAPFILPAKLTPF